MRSNRFKHIHSQSAINSVTRLCRLLAHYGNVFNISSHFLALAEEPESPGSQAALFCLNEFSRAVNIPPKEDVPILLSLDDPLFESFTTLADFLVILHADKLDIGRRTGKEDSSEALPANDNSDLVLAQRVRVVHLLTVAQRDLEVQSMHMLTQEYSRLLTQRSRSSSCASVEAISLLLRGMGNIAKSLGSEFSLKSSLYSILESLGQGEKMIVDAARYALSATASAHSLGIAELVVENMDYVTNECMRRFRRLSLYPRAPLVLSACVRVVNATSTKNHGTNEIVDHIYDLVESILDEIDKDTYHTEFIGVLFDVLEAVSFGVMETRLPLRVKPEPRSLVLDLLDEEDIEVESEDEDVCETHEPEDAREFFEKRIKEEDESEETATPEEIVVPPTRQQELTHKVLLRMPAFLSHESVTVRRHAVRIVGACLHSTEKHLEMIHLCWDQVTARLFDPDVGVVRCTLELLIDITCHSGDFITRRMVDLAPKLKKAGEVPQTRHLVVKLFSEVLQECTLKMEDIWKIEDLILPIANKDILLSLAEKDPDGIWLWTLRAQKTEYLIDGNGKKYTFPLQVPGSASIDRHDVSLLRYLS